jgi:hypothetical protein
LGRATRHGHAQTAERHGFADVRISHQQHALIGQVSRALRQQLHTYAAGVGFEHRVGPLLALWALVALLALLARGSGAQPLQRQVQVFNRRALKARAGITLQAAYHQRGDGAGQCLCVNGGCGRASCFGRRAQTLPQL